MKITTTSTRGAAVLAAGLVVAACGGLPERVDSLEQARAAVRTAERDPLASEAASAPLRDARQALEAADSGYENGRSLDYIEHQAYMAQRYADIAEQRIAEAHAKEQIEQGQAQRNQVLLEARTREAERAQQRNEALQAQSRDAQQSVDQLRQQAEEAQQRAQEAEQRNQELEQQLSEFQAKETERGLVLTLGDVLFDTAQASLKPGAQSTLDRLATFLNEHPDRRLLIEGHTDSRGAEDYNEQLSERRAQAVQQALATRGIDASRIRTVGLGEAYPVATNETVAGRQENRRVEIVLSDESGSFPADQRTAATTN